MWYHTKIFVTNNHLSFLHTWYSMVTFCSCPPPPPPTDEFLKNALAISRQFDVDSSFFKLLIERTTLPEYDGVSFILI